ncbi:MAG: hypothetical protein K6F52_07805, partial [Clostridia bacterium]|nr:hypothetical protein [Clostridia bacterium]
MRRPVVGIFIAYAAGIGFEFYMGIGKWIAVTVFLAATAFVILFLRKKDGIVSGESFASGGHARQKEKGVFLWLLVSFFLLAVFRFDAVSDDL